MARLNTGSRKIILYRAECVCVGNGGGFVCMGILDSLETGPKFKDMPLII